MSKRGTVLESTFAVLRAHGMKVMFGNPGSNELPFLAGMPADFDYVLGLHEGVVVGMADGYAQATGQPVLVSLHAASGSGNAMGALTNARYAHSPLVLLAGQQVRRTVGQEVMLSSVDAAALPRPLVKWAHEPLAAEDVPRAVSQAILEASTEPRGPTYLSVPYDDWKEGALADDEHLPARRVRTAGALDADLVAELVARLDRAQRPVLVLGPDADGAQPAATALAERLGCPVWIAPSPCRAPFPTGHGLFAGILPAGMESVRARLEPHDAVLVVGAPVMRYHKWEPSAYLSGKPDVIHITCDPSEATRAPYGDAVIASIAPALRALADGVRDRAQGPFSVREIAPAYRDARGMTGEEVLEVLNARTHEGITYVNETTTLDAIWMSRVALSRPRQYHFPASGGLGFGLPAAVGIALARPEVTVVATVGDGSANYGITALWTAAQRRTRVVFVIVNNGTYGALRRFAAAMDAENAPGLDVPGIDFVQLAQGYGVPASRTTSREEFETAYAQALAAEGPVLIDARVLP
ncbi:benzoylformate decarboxylase [Cutaneotrichosporon oleaginosum]|uniref:Benzoylformate decarboxylase n=1 Tax=Cutaneotrichosporon oleaginosum TaxID=879819 RepID=A0A0J0XHI2_9TREE|nr:benzoylformate decarboxylase [Cutaneotrichosporon oleaginosum]KLT40518.1 benzoylformate decarboxylase [Cutaneotrichosporon oleaginosum]TXT08410.1 hypothetical protein COLE_05334 [Cutaneotrichosporon oleaginosum]